MNNDNLGQILVDHALDYWTIKRKKNEKAKVKGVYLFFTKKGKERKVYFIEDKE